jgi:maltose O-acetyltransferase
MLLRSLVRDLLHWGYRAQWIETLIRNIPGDFGVELRRVALSRYFGSVGEGLTIYPGARIFGASELHVGKNFWLGLDNLIHAHGGVHVGDDVMLGPGVKIWTVNHVYDQVGVPIIEQGYNHAPVTIGDRVWIGSNCIILPGARIGDDVVVSAGAVVGGKPIPPRTVVAGNPARVISRREPAEVRSGRPARQPAYQSMTVRTSGARASSPSPR